MQDDLAKRLTRPIVGMECRTPLEVFDIMSDRIRRAVISNQAARDDALEQAAKLADGRSAEWKAAIDNGLQRVSCSEAYAQGSRDNCDVIAAAIRNMKGSNDGR